MLASFFECILNDVKQPLKIGELIKHIYKNNLSLLFD
jgi:hypothetical protein